MWTMIRILSILILLYLFPALRSDEFSLESMLGTKGELFNTCDADMFLVPGTVNHRYFSWTSAKRDSARYPGYANSPRNLSFAGLPVSEAIFHFEKRSLTDIHLSLFNRGDDGQITLENFNALLKTIDDTLSSRSNAKGLERKGRYGNDAESWRKVWSDGNLAYILRWNISKEGRRKEDQPEFIQLDISPFDPQNDPRQLKSVTRVSRKDLKNKTELAKNVVRQKNGTVFIDGIPMVNQGNKGYCAAALSERLLKYFGNSEITQHTIAQLADVSATHGTSYEQMLTAIQKSGRKLGLKMESDYQLFEDFHSVEKILKDYNSLARRRKLPTIKRSRGMVDVGLLLASMDIELFLELREDENRERQAFFRTLRKNIDSGLPLVWGVFLGLQPEPGIPTGQAGGHLRLIIGYNPQSQSIIYSDTWGDGHEKKEMSLIQAWNITHSTFTCEPW
ncbi:MAG: hypothetical protein WCT05_08875 [Lentisphaeria bacterium]